MHASSPFRPLESDSGTQKKGSGSRLDLWTGTERPYLTPTAFTSSKNHALAVGPHVDAVDDQMQFDWPRDVRWSRGHLLDIRNTKVVAILCGDCCADLALVLIVHMAADSRLTPAVC